MCGISKLEAGMDALAQLLHWVKITQEHSDLQVEFAQPDNIYLVDGRPHPVQILG